MFVCPTKPQVFKMTNTGKNMNYNKELFYKPEHVHIDNKFIISLKRNNFFEWLNNQKIDTYHIFKKGKKRISRRLKDQCWIKEYNNKVFGICPIPTCNVEIFKNEHNLWHAGHIISEYNGGETDINNLRPICKLCNLDMGSMNWDDYIND